MTVPAVVLPTPPWEVLTGDCLPYLEDMDPASVDAVVTDPPYGIAVDKKWDQQLPDVRIWKELVRVVKPGGYALVFSASRLAYRMWGQLEDSGWELRDMVLWLYGGSGKVKGPTDLRAAYEPMMLCRRPLTDTIDENRKRFGTGLLGIDNCWLGDGRWPANVLLDESVRDEMPDRWTRYYLCAKPGLAEREAGLDRFKPTSQTHQSIGGWSGWARKNFHKTVKPLELMQWLVRLVAPKPDMLVLDPFCGSGTTGMATILEARRFLGLEMGPESAELARARCAHAEHMLRTTTHQLKLI